MIERERDPFPARLKFGKPRRIEGLGQLETSGDNEVQAAQIGAMVMEALKGFDNVAYIRFASVYRDFTEAKDFEEFASSITEAARPAK